MRHRQKPVWLFSFTDIAFLLLLVYTQLARLSSANTPVAEMALPAPVVVENPDLTIMRSQKDYWQVLVEKHSGQPYRLAHIVSGNESSRSDPMSFSQFSTALQVLINERKDQPRPVVVPLPESFSSDLLQATALVGKLWNERGGAVVHLGAGER